MKDDTIYRQEAIDAVKRLLDSMVETDTVGFHEIENVLFEVSSAQTDLITKIQNGIKATDADDAYSCGMRNGMRWCISLMDGKEPSYENCPAAQPEITLESAIDYLHSIGWMQEHDRIMSASAQPDFNTVEKIDKAYDDGYKCGYLQAKSDYETDTRGEQDG